MVDTRTGLMGRITLTAACVVLYRIGSSTPLPTVRPETVAALAENPGDTLWQQFAGTPMSSLAFFAVGVVPFVTSGLVLQLLRNVLPALRNLEDTGDARERLRRLRRDVLLLLASLQALVVVTGHRRPGHAAASAIGAGIPDAAASFALLLLGFGLTGLIAGVITRYGTGSGVSVLLLTNVLAVVGARLNTLLPELTPGMLAWGGGLLGVGLLLVIVGTRSHHVLSVRSARLDNAASAPPVELRAHILQGGVITLIFAASLLGVVVGLLRPVLDLFGRGDALTVGSPAETALYLLLVVVFARLQFRVVLDPVDVANDLVKRKYFLDGIRPGWPTADRISGMSNSAAVALLLVLLPLTVSSSLGGPLSGGVTVLVPASTLLLVGGIGIELLRGVRDGAHAPLGAPPLETVHVGRSPWDEPAART